MENSHLGQLPAGKELLYWNNKESESQFILAFLDPFIFSRERIVRILRGIRAIFQTSSNPIYKRYEPEIGHKNEIK